MSDAKSPVRMAADIGGTFTDIVLEANGHLSTSKVLTTPKAPEVAVVEGARAVLAEAGVSEADIAALKAAGTLIEPD